MPLQGRYGLGGCDSQQGVGEAAKGACLVLLLFAFIAEEDEAAEANME